MNKYCFHFHLSQIRYAYCFHRRSNWINEKKEQVKSLFQCVQVGVKKVYFPILSLYFRYSLVLNLKSHTDLRAQIIISASRKESTWLAKPRNSQELISITQQVTNLELWNHKWALGCLNHELIGLLPWKRLVMIRILIINKLKEWKFKNKSYLSLLVFQKTLTIECV